jgi:hypothetical protein
VILSDRHEDLAATFFCALDADHSGFLTEMDISLLLTESQTIKHRDVRDNVNLGGDSVRRGAGDSKKGDGLKEFIRCVVSKLMRFFSAFLLRHFDQDCISYSDVQQIPSEKSEFQTI